SINANTAPPRPSTHRSAPTKSTLRRGPEGVAAGTALRIKDRQAITNGTLITKINRHDATFKIVPAMSGPRAPAIVPHAVQVPKAVPAATPSGPRRRVDF